MKKTVLLGIALLLTACAAPTVPPPLTSQPASNQALYILDSGKTGFSIFQSGKIVIPKVGNGYLTYSLENKPFELRTAYKGMRVYVSEKDTGEFRQTDKSKFNVLSSALIGAAGADDHTIFIADNNDPLSSNNSIGVSSGLKEINPSLNAYEVTNFYHLKTEKETALQKFTGVLFAYAWVDLNGDKKIGLNEVSRLKIQIYPQ